MPVVLGLESLLGTCCSALMEVVTECVNTEISVQGIDGSAG